TARFGSGKELAEFDGSLRANAVALSVASHFIDGTGSSGTVAQLDARLQVHVYQKGESSVGFMCGRPEKALHLAGTRASPGPAIRGLSFFDIMGYPIPDEILSVTDSPIYFTFDG